MVASYRPNREIDLVRNPDWSRSTDFRPAYLDKIVMPEGNDANLAARQVLLGSQMVSGDFLVPPALLAQAVRHHPAQLALIDSGGGRWASLNTTMAPFDNADVRRAVVAGFNREAALMALGGKTVGTVATHFLPPGMPGFARAGGAGERLGGDRPADHRAGPAVPLTWDKVSMLHSTDVHAVANENLGVWDLAFTSLR